MFIIGHWAFWASTLFAYARTCSLVTSLLSYVLVSSLIISASAPLSFNLCLNFSFTYLSISVWFLSTAANLSQTIHSSAFSFGCLTTLWNCNDLMVSLYCGLHLLFNVVHRPSIVIHLSSSVWVNVSRNCRPFLPSQSFMIAIFSVCAVLYDLNMLFTSNMKFLSSLYFVFCFPGEWVVSSWVHLFWISHLVFLHALCYFLLQPQTWSVLSLSLLQPLHVLWLEWYLSAQLPSFCICIFSISISCNCLCLPFWDFYFWHHVVFLVIVKITVVYAYIHLYFYYVSLTYYMCVCLYI